MGQQLVKFEPYPGLDAVELKLVLATKETKIKDIKTKEFELKLYSLILEIYRLTNFKLPEEHDLKYTLKKSISLIDLKYKFLTLQEIRICFESGAAKEYGEFHGISYTTIAVWLNHYVLDNKRKDALRIQREFEEGLIGVKQIELTAEQKRMEKIENCKASFRLYQKYKRLCLPFIYDNLVEFGLLVLDIGTKNMYMTEARESLIKDAQNKRARGEIRNLSEVIKLINEPLNKSVIEEAKDIALKAFFDDLIENKEELIII